MSIAAGLPHLFKEEGGVASLRIMCVVLKDDKSRAPRTTLLHVRDTLLREKPKTPGERKPRVLMGLWRAGTLVRGVAERSTCGVWVGPRERRRGGLHQALSSASGMPHSVGSIGH